MDAHITYRLVLNLNSIINEEKTYGPFKLYTSTVAD